MEATSTRQSQPSTAGAIRGVMPASDSARRFKNSVAMAVVVLPFIGTVAGAVLLWGHGVSALDLWLLVVMYVLTITGITAGFHRHFAHRAFKARPSVRWILGILGSMSAQGPLLFWVATHRRHHIFSDGPGDPHSPNQHGSGFAGTLKGLWHAHIGWMFSKEITSWAHYCADLLRDRTSFTINQTYFIWVLLGFAFPAAVGGLVTQSWQGAFTGFLWGGLIRMFLVNHACWCVGSFCHVFGYRPFDNKDRSANNYLVALVSFGEGLQNNHHAFPNSANHKVRWWEPDISAWIIRLMAVVGLVYEVKLPTASQLAKAYAGGTGAGEY